MSKGSVRTIWRPLAFIAALVAILSVGVLAQLPAGTSATAVAAHHPLAMGAIDPDAAARLAHNQASVLSKSPEGNRLSAEEQAYKIRAFPADAIPSDGYANATYQYNLLNNNSAGNGWTERGPNYTPNSDFFDFNHPNYPRNTVSGRATAFAVDPSTCTPGNCSTQYLGTANGGFWKSTDGGSTWQELFDLALNTAIGGITLDPINPNIIYIGTGEGNNSGDSNRGFGIYRSTDAGVHFVQLGQNDPTDGIPNVFTNRAVTRILVDPRPSMGAGTTNATLYVGTTTGTLGCATTTDTCTIRAPGRPPIGFFYSHDGGSTWTESNPSDIGRAGQRVADLMFDPSNPNILYVAYYYYGVYRTMTDAQPASSGVGPWTRLAGQPDTGDFYRVTFDFARSTANQTPQTMYVLYNLPYDPTTGQPDCNLITNPVCQVGGPEVLYQVKITAPQTPDGTPVFTQRNNPNACDGQCWYDMPLRVDPRNANILYAGGSANYGYLFGGSCTPFYPLPTYCNASLMKSTDGGQTWRDIEQDSHGTVVHPDDHFIFINPVDSSTLWTQNDGGNYRANGVNALNTNSGGGVVPTWSDENPGIDALQFQGIGVGPTDNVIGGTQDNGTFLTHPNSTTGQHILLGDGGQGVADPFNANLYYSEQYGATMYRFNNPTCDFQVGNFPEAYPGCGQTWVAPFAADYFDYGGGSFYQPQTTAKYNRDGTQASNNIFHGTFRVWRSLDFGGVDVNHDGDVTNDPAEQQAHPSYWLPISGDLSCGLNNDGTPCYAGNIVSINVAPTDPNTVVVSTSNGRLYITHNALAPVVTDQGANYCPPTTYDPNVADYVATCAYQSGVTWTEIDGGLPHRVVTEAAFLPGSNTSFYVTLSGFDANTPSQPGHVFKTTDSGATFTDQDGTTTGYILPDMPYNSIQINSRNNHIYVSADFGVFESYTSSNWFRIDGQLPNTPVYQLRLNPNSTLLYAATHGRGIWQGFAP